MLIKKKQKVLDFGFVELIDVMGDDAAIVEAARVSYQKGTRQVSDDRNLIRYLMRMEHHSPFEMCSLKFNIKMPIYCARQMVRHRTAKMNEISGRYSIMEDESQRTLPNEWRLQDDKNKQGSRAGKLEWKEGMRVEYPGGGYNTPYSPEEFLCKQEADLHIKTRQVYETRLKFGIAREQARKDLPLSLYTQFYWKMDLRNLLHFLRLRMDSHAQLEIREYANTIAYFVKELFPLTYEAFQDYQVDSVTLSGPEVKALRYIQFASEYQGNEPLSYYHNPIDSLSKRELEEFQAKIKKLGLSFSEAEGV